MMNWVRIKAVKLIWRKEDASLMSFNLCKEILLLIIVCWCHIAWHDILREETNK